VIVKKEIATIDSTHNDMPHDSGNVDTGVTWHRGRIAGGREAVNKLTISPQLSPSRRRTTGNARLFRNISPSYIFLMKTGYKEQSSFDMKKSFSCGTLCKNQLFCLK
jgi:hypothetical protein